MSRFVLEQSGCSFRSLSYRRGLPPDRLTSPVISWSPQFTYQQTITSFYNNRIRTPLCGQTDRQTDRQTVLQLSKYSGHCSVSRLCLLSGKMVYIERLRAGLMDKAREHSLRFVQSSYISRALKIWSIEAPTLRIMGPSVRRCLCSKTVTTKQN